MVPDTGEGSSCAAWGGAPPLPETRGKRSHHARLAALRAQHRPPSRRPHAASPFLGPCRGSRTPGPSPGGLPTPSVSRSHEWVTWEVHTGAGTASARPPGGAGPSLPGGTARPAAHAPGRPFGLRKRRRRRRRRPGSRCRVTAVLPSAHWAGRRGAAARDARRWARAGGRGGGGASLRLGKPEGRGPTSWCLTFWLWLPLENQCPTLGPGPSALLLYLGAKAPERRPQALAGLWAAEVSRAVTSGGPKRLAEVSCAFMSGRAGREGRGCGAERKA